MQVSHGNIPHIHNYGNWLFSTTTIFKLSKGIRMKLFNMKLFKKISLTAFLALFVFNATAHAQFIVTPKESADSPPGSPKFYFDYVAQVLVDQGIVGSYAAGVAYATNNYIGHNPGDQDPFYAAGPTSTLSLIIEELAGFANQNLFGIYDQTNPANKIQVFNGADNSGTPPVATTVPYNGFGFYLSAPNPATWYTDRFLNAPGQAGPAENPGGDPQFLMYHVSPADYLIFAEDADYTQSYSDHDFNDMVVKVTVTPEPATVVLFALGGLALLAVVTMKRKSFATLA